MYSSCIFRLHSPRATDRTEVGPRPIQAYPTAVRLGIEMVLHEEAERRAMEGELIELERAWRDAERIAAISDDLLLPGHVTEFLDKHRKR